MLEFESLELVNFFNIRHVQIPLKDQGFVMIRGENGEGKTAMFVEGPYFAVYGKSPRTEKALGSTLKRRGAKGWVTRITMSDGDNRYMIQRSRGFSKKDIASGIVLTCNGKDISRGSDKDTQEFINQHIMCMSPQTARQTVFYSSDILAFPTMTDTKKKEVLDDLLQFRALESAFLLTKTRQQEIDSELRELELEKSQHDSKLLHLEQSLKQSLDLSADWVEQRAPRLQAATGSMEAAQGALDKVREEWETAQKAVENFDGVRLEELKTESAPLTQKIEELRNQVEQENSADVQVLTGLSTERRLLEVRLDKVSSQEGKAECEVCGSPLGEKYEEEILKLRGELDAKKEEEEEQKRSKATSAQTSIELKSVHDQFETLSAEYDTMASEITRLRNAASLLEGRVSVAETALTNAQDNLTSIQQQENPFEAPIATAREAIKKTKEELAPFEDLISEKKKEQEDEQIIEQVFAVKGCRNILLEQALPQLNYHAEIYRQTLESDISVQFRLRGDDEAYSGTFTLDVNNPNGAEEYFWDSRGERRRVDMMALASLLELAKARGSNTVGQAFFDEAFESLDAKGDAAVYRLIRHLSRDQSSVFVISHEQDDFEGKVDQQWTVENGELIR